MAFPEYASDTKINNVTYTFTTPDEMVLELSNEGIMLHLDDLIVGNENYDPDNPIGVVNTNYLIQLCQRATSHIMSRLGNRYTADILYKLPRIREIATYWALYKLTGRRGNPRLYEGDYVEAMEDLEGFANGTLFLNAPTTGQRALIQSYVVDNRFTLKPLRVIAEASLGLKPGQATAWRFPFAWL